MRIGYPCINRRIGCTANTTFRLSSYSEENLISKASANLECLSRTLKWNLENGFTFFRIGSGLIPFASHDICSFDWQNYFKESFRQIASFIRLHNLRITMHPDQFTVLNSPDKKIRENSIRELVYHQKIFKSLELGQECRIEIHAGGLYNDREKALSRFCEVYNGLDSSIRKHLAVENDDRLFSVSDCLKIHEKTGIPVVFDCFHHECLNHGELMKEAILSCFRTWSEKDGLLITHYSSQQSKARKGSHAQVLDKDHFIRYFTSVRELDFDLMLEIKEKEAGALELKTILAELFKI